MRKDREPPTLDQVGDFLAARHGQPVAELEQLSGGFWSSAYGYRTGSQDLVVRFGRILAGFVADQDAMRFASPALPVPRVLELGPAPDLGADLAFAISERHYGRFLEDCPPSQGTAVGHTLLRLLVALHAVPSEAANATGWHDWLLDAFADRPEHPVTGWRTAMTERPELERLFQAVETRVRTLLDACPQRQDLVHGDLLHQNVLVTPRADQVTAVFSWKCSMRGDFLFDVAWCSFWGPWHPGIAAAKVWERVLAEPRFAGDLADASARHLCYQLQIGASHIGWYLWNQDTENLARVTGQLELLLDS